MKIEGELEIDEKRGVIYFHSFKTGQTVLRICSLPKTLTTKKIEEGLDITHMQGCNWGVRPLYIKGEDYVKT